MRAGISVCELWEFALGVGIVISYCVFARWNDAALLQWDGVLHSALTGTSQEHPVAEVYVIIARRAVIREARTLFRQGHVLPLITAHGPIISSLQMPYRSYVRHLRHAIVQVGVPAAESLSFAGQSARAGAATDAVYAGLSPSAICRMAGVSTISWCLGYVRPDQADRIAESQKLGL